MRMELLGQAVVDERVADDEGDQAERQEGEDRERGEDRQGALAAVRLGRCSCGRPSSSEAKGSAHLQGKRNSLQTLRSALRENGGHW